VAHTCNPSYSGGRDQEDHRLKLVQANSSQDPMSKIQKRADGMAQVVEHLPTKCKASTTKKKKKKKLKE
jgi:hypothetical protein